jgi:hypothetical protein
MRKLIQQLIIFTVLASFTAMVVNFSAFNLNQTEEELVEEPIDSCPKNPNEPGDIHHFDWVSFLSFHDVEMEEKINSAIKCNLDQWANYKSPWIDTPFSPPEFKA